MQTSSHTLDRLDVSFDDDHLVASAGLLLPATLGQRLGLKELFDSHVDLGSAPGRANVGHKAMTVVHSLLAGGDSIEDCDALRAGGTGAVLGHEQSPRSGRLGPGVRPPGVRGFGHDPAFDRLGRCCGRRAGWCAGSRRVDSGVGRSARRAAATLYPRDGIRRGPWSGGAVRRRARCRASTR